MPWDRFRRRDIVRVFQLTIGGQVVASRIGFEAGDSLKSRLVRYAYVKARSRSGLQGWLLNRVIPGRRHWD